MKIIPVIQCFCVWESWLKLLKHCVCVCVCVCMHTQPCLAVCDPMNCRPPGSSAHGIFQARILEWGAVFYSRGFSWPRDQTCVPCTSCVSCIGRQILYHCDAWEALLKHNACLQMQVYPHCLYIPITRMEPGTQSSIFFLMWECLWISWYLASRIMYQWIGNM